MTEPTNEKRAERAMAALTAYAAFYNERLDEDDIGDLIADLHHYLRKRGEANPIDVFEEYLRVAVDNFNAEVREELNPVKTTA